MTEYILCGTLMLALVTFYIGYKTGSEKLFYKIGNVYFLFVVLHSLFAIIGISFLEINDTLIIGAPFILGYAPFFYIGLKSITNGEVLKKDIFIHFIPLFLFTLFYILIISSTTLQNKYFSLFYILQYSLVTFSFFAYAIWAMVVISASGSENNTDKNQLIKTGAFSLGSLGVFFAIAAIAGLMSGKNIKEELIANIIHSGIFISMVLAFIFRVNNIIVALKDNKTKSAVKEEVDNTVIEEKLPEIKNIEEEDQSKKVTEIQPPQKYNKSALSPVVLDDYKSKLDHLINNEKVYLDNELTLEVLARKMRMPMHHLTQLFNVHLGENFNQYINKFRIEYACELLLENDGSLSIEQIAFNSGFNSKVSFNRHFKNLTGNTPKEYAHSKNDN